RSRDFWLLAGTFFVCGASTNGLIGTHLIPACMDHGIPEVTAAGVLATMGIFDLFGTTASGWLSDRIASRKPLFTYSPPARAALPPPRAPRAPRAVGVHRPLWTGLGRHGAPRGGAGDRCLRKAGRSGGLRLGVCFPPGRGGVCRAGRRGDPYRARRVPAGL